MYKTHHHPSNPHSHTNYCFIMTTLSPIMFLILLLVNQSFQSLNATLAGTYIEHRGNIHQKEREVVENNIDDSNGEDDDFLEDDIEIPDDTFPEDDIEISDDTVQYESGAFLQRGKAVQQRGKAVQQRGKAVQQRGKAVQQRGKAVQQRGKAVQ